MRRPSPETRYALGTQPALSPRAIRPPVSVTTPPVRWFLRSEPGTTAMSATPGSIPCANDRHRAMASLQHGPSPPCTTTRAAESERAPKPVPPTTRSLRKSNRVPNGGSFAATRRLMAICCTAGCLSHTSDDGSNVTSTTPATAAVAAPANRVRVMRRDGTCPRQPIRARRRAACRRWRRAGCSPRRPAGATSRAHHRTRSWRRRHGASSPPPRRAADQTERADTGRDR